jgi:thioredoxin 1
MIILNKESFKKLVFDFDNEKEWKFAGERPAIVDFYADWCGPCKMVTPILEEISKEYNGLVDVYKINVDIEQEVAGAFGVSSIPTILFIPKEGQPRAAQGALPAQAFRDVIADVFAIKKSA